MFIQLRRYDNNHQISFNIHCIQYFEVVIEGANEGEHAMINGEIEVVETYEEIRKLLGSNHAPASNAMGNPGGIRA